MSKTTKHPVTSTTRELGQKFLDFYRERGHAVISGSSLLDESVPMSFVMSAGMVQFEHLANGRRNGDQFCLIQNCFRYFDLERIGSSRIHLSLFQMPGSFAFGIPDRQAAIAQFWELLTTVFRFDPLSLVATYFAGDRIDGQEIPADTASASAWHSAAGLPPERIFGLSSRYNFWSQSRQAVGDSNSQKRGPNTELFYDRGIQHDCGKDCFPGCPCGRYIEFANILFITHKINAATGLLTPLEEPFTEVVIGLERAAMILQARESVFEIDSLSPLIHHLRNFTKPLPMEDGGLEPQLLEFILVDHLRALLFLVADGAPPPGKGGRARLMRILIRELLTCQQLLGISDRGFIRSMILVAGQQDPHLLLAKGRLLEYMKRETEVFEQTLQSGLKDLRFLAGQRLSDETLAHLRNTRGLPVPLLRYRLWRQNTKGEI